MTKDIKQYVEQAKTLSDSSTQNRDINKLIFFRSQDVECIYRDMTAERRDDGKTD